MAVVEDCPMITAVAGQCWKCGKPLPKYRRHWCSDDCGRWWARNHIWTIVRAQALRRDGFACVKCGNKEKLEVNHIEPRNGQGYLSGCWNHLDNLETLCHECHVRITTEQIRERKREKRGWWQLELTV
jgi:5-methylcytosine-specific restriction endonuclease McrA